LRASRTATTLRSSAESSLISFQVLSVVDEDQLEALAA
jgi:hypothetical protein